MPKHELAGCVVVGVEELRVATEDQHTSDRHGAEGDDEARLAALAGPVGFDAQAHRRPIADRAGQLGRAARWCATNATSPATAPRRRGRRTGRRARRRTARIALSGLCRESRVARRSTSGRIGSGHVRAVAAIVPTMPCSAVSRSRSCSHHEARAVMRSCSTFGLMRRSADARASDVPAVTHRPGRRRASR